MALVSASKSVAVSAVSVTVEILGSSMRSIQRSVLSFTTNICCIRTYLRRFFTSLLSLLVIALRFTTNNSGYLGMDGKKVV